MIHLDTSVLVDALTGPARLAPQLREAVHTGERLLVSTLVLYEWLRGPRTDAELHLQAQLFPQDTALPFAAPTAARAAALYQLMKRPRGREIDLAIAACAIEHSAVLWTLNADDFKDIPGLILHDGGNTPGHAPRR